ncbi:MAG: hypothetical protein COX90_01020 [Candidatus Nealsonbacteria bacterium CG_4_10_14_0_2_um_filter_38_17]|uniref:SCP domain-containing protein n=1 Tax=Candidatus Nealsonbacteria bacterium CG_4_10_14_0_2_um_filter_38_17 TaxID=1974680 RepID=A0A2M7UYX3_9BACT|nr:MAG: hypothetical protein COX90_01020 [Candidatus Nealsonbacteria bacterium CG_4_10_14_0_2_um_filter_38_17]
MKKTSIIIVGFALILGAALFFWDDILNFYSILSLRLPKIEKGVSDFLINEIEKQIITPPPLRAQKEEQDAFLTKAGVIQLTNAERIKNGLPPLQENSKLDSSAQLKLDDMFKNQYFEHTSPSGQGVSDLAREVDYEFLVIGENLALGNFKNDATLVQDWMESPGHRANILNPQYKEIGITVGKGIFEGHTTWLAVQHFGTPLSVCPRPSDAIKTRIEVNEVQLEKFKQTITSLQNQIEKTRPKRGDFYLQLIEQYNSLVYQYNTLASENKKLIDSYNTKVQQFNSCVSALK